MTEQEKDERIVTLEGTIAEQGKKIESLIEELATTTKVSEEQSKKIESLTGELATTTKVNEGLTKQIEEGALAPTAASADDETFVIDGKKVRFAFQKMKHKGILITPAEVLASEDLQKELYEQKSSMLKY